MIPEKIFLIGLPGSGKSTIGKRLSTEIGFDLIDVDKEIERKHQCSIKEIFHKHGEDHFRLLEHKAIKKATKTKGKWIISTGGGAPCFHNNMDLMNASGLTVFLDIPLPIITDRLAGNTKRPLMQDYTLEELYEKRKGWYHLAKIKVSSYEMLLLKIKSYS